jgi:hypothetical protein
MAKVYNEKDGPLECPTCGQPDLTYMSDADLARYANQIGSGNSNVENEIVLEIVDRLKDLTDSQLEQVLSFVAGIRENRPEMLIDSDPFIVTKADLERLNYR